MRLRAMFTKRIGKSVGNSVGGRAGRVASAPRDARDRRDGTAGPVERLEPRTLLSAGSLDPSFGNNGELAVSFPTGQSITVVRDSLVQPDGKILVTGEANDPTGPGKSDFAIARLNPDGTPDLTFNNGAGIFVYPSPGNSDKGTGVALQSDGKIVVSVTLQDITSDGIITSSLYVVARFNADGTVDHSFGDQGAEDISFTTTGVDGEIGDAQKVLVGPDDKITLVGYAAPDPTQSYVNLALARLNPDGTPDATFGTGGKVLTSVYGDSEFGFSGAFDASGNLIVTGTAAVKTNGDANVIAARFHPDGTLDTSFGDRGAALTDFAAPSDAATIANATAVAVQPDGKIVVGGAAVHIDANVNTTGHFILARYNPDGTPDTRFGDGGKVETDFGQITVINKLLIDDQGRIIASGLAAANADAADAEQFSPIVAQYTPRGVLDPTFGNRGAVIININPAATTAGTATPAATPAARFAADAADAAGATGAAGAALGLSPAAASNSASTSQQLQSDIARQAAIIVALGDKLLVVSTSSNNQLTAARLIGNGADLVAGPISGSGAASVVGGAKAALSVPVVNAGNEPLAGNVTLTILLSPDPSADASDATAATVGSRLSLKPGKGKTFKVKFNYPAGVPDGSYYVLAVVDAGAADVNPANNTSAATTPVTVAKPFVSLAGTVAPPPPLIDGKKVALVLALQDAGNVPASGPVGVTVYASSDAALDAADRAVAGPAPLRVSLRPGKAKTVKLPFLVPADLAPGPYFLIASLDESALPLSNAPAATIVTTTQTSAS